MVKRDGAILRSKRSDRGSLGDYRNLEVGRTERSCLGLLFCDSDKTTHSIAEYLGDYSRSRLRSCISGNREAGSGDGDAQGEPSYFVEVHGEILDMMEARQRRCCSMLTG